MDQAIQQVRELEQENVQYLAAKEQDVAEISQMIGHFSKTLLGENGLQAL